MERAHARRLGRDAADRSASGPSWSSEVLEQVRERGPIAASRARPSSARGAAGPWWDWSDSKRALEWLFWSGQVTSARRRRFERLYDLPERVLPRAGRSTAPTPPDADAQRELIRIAARSLRGRRRARPARLLPPARRRRRSRGSPSWSRPASWCRSRSRAGGERRATCAPARGSRARVDARGADRAVRLADLGAQPASSACSASRYPPRDLRPGARSACHGYYVLPFLLGDRLVARVDLKADRAAGVLRVRADPPRARRAGRDRARRSARELRRDGGLARARVRRPDLSHSLPLLQKVK